VGTDGVENGVFYGDSPVQPLHLRERLDPQRCAERRSELGENGYRLLTPARAMQSDHQLGVEILIRGITLDQGSKLT
jgi:hypothetical protein